jgi:hypothetical protein
MKLMHLFLRSRRVDVSMLCLLGVGILAYWLARVNFFFPVPLDNKSIPFPALFIIPLASAVVLGASTFSPFGEAEQTASRPLPLFRFAHLLGLFVWGAMTLLLSASVWKEAHAEVILLRNLVGFAGLAFLSIPLLGSRLSWVVPFIFGLLAFRLGVIGIDRMAWWAWPFHPAKNTLAAAIALVLLVLGLVCACLLKARETSGDAE